MEGTFKPQIFQDNYVDQVKQTKSANEAEKILEPGEVVVVSFDRIRELKKNVDGKIYISNYRVSSYLKSNFLQNTSKIIPFFSFFPPQYVTLRSSSWKLKTLIRKSQIPQLWAHWRVK